jgi:AAA+ superfamily predicted ATPase
MYLLNRSGDAQVLMATNRPDTLDPALMRPGRLDRKVEFGLPDLEGRAHIFRIHARSMSVERDIRFDLLARLCPNSTGAEIRSVLFAKCCREQFCRPNSCVLCERAQVRPRTLKRKKVMHKKVKIFIHHLELTNMY